MKKIVVNTCFGGFGLSPKAEAAYIERKYGRQVFFYEEGGMGSGGWNDRTFIRYDRLPSTETLGMVCLIKDYGTSVVLKDVQDEDYAPYCRDIDRDDPVLVQIVEELGEEANGLCAELEIREIPDDVEWYINEYDGMESIHESHRSW